MSSACVWIKERLKIGNNVKIGALTVIMDNDAHSLDFQERGRMPENKDNVKSSPISIGNDVMIGMNCLILKGVTIGDRSVIGAGSVVTRSVPADCIAAGNPCRIIRKLV